MKKADKPVVMINGNDNEVEVNVTITETPSKTPAVIVIAASVIMVTTVLAVSLCCPELLAEYIRFVFSMVVGS